MVSKIRQTESKSKNAKPAGVPKKDRRLLQSVKKPAYVDPKGDKKLTGKAPSIKSTPAAGKPQGRATRKPVNKKAAEEWSLTPDDMPSLAEVLVGMGYADGNGNALLPAPVKGSYAPKAVNGFNVAGTLLKRYGIPLGTRQLPRDADGMTATDEEGNPLPTVYRTALSLQGIKHRDIPRAETEAFYRGLKVRYARELSEALGLGADDAGEEEEEEE